jgi:hypothetical protein
MTFGDAPLGPREFDFTQLSPKHFEFLCQLLVKTEFRDAIGTADPDGGADALLTNANGAWERAWQAKRFTRQIRWPQCRASLDEAIAEYQIRHMTFCFARQLTVSRLRAWRELQGDYPQLQIDFWDKTHLTALLVGSDQGQRIARMFFGARPPAAADINRIIQAGVLLQTGQHALDRVIAFVEQAAERDPHYAYTFVGFEPEHEAPITPGTAMSVLEVRGGAASRIDAIPRPDGLASANPPTLRVAFDDDERGRLAAQQFEQAFHGEDATTIGEGVVVSPSNLPELFQDLIGAPHRASITLTPLRRPPWEIICEAATDRGSASFAFSLRRELELRDDRAIRMTGTRSGVTLHLDARPHGDKARLSVTCSHRLDDSTLVEHVDALRFLSAVCGSGTVTIRDVAGRVPPIVSRVSSHPFEADWIVELLEDMVYVQALAGVQFELPETITSEDAFWFRWVAEIFRTGRATLTWSGTRITRPSTDSPPAPEGAVRIEQHLSVRLLGQEIALGQGVLDIPRVEMVDHGLAAGNAAQRIVELRPPGGDPIEVEWRAKSPLRSG